MNVTKEEVIKILEKSSTNSFHNCECSKIEHRYIHNVRFSVLADEILKIVNNKTMTKLERLKNEMEEAEIVADVLWDELDESFSASFIAADAAFDKAYDAYFKELTKQQNND